MRPQTFVGILGFVVAIIGGFVIDQASDGSGAALIPIIIGIVMMAAAWLVRWPGDTDDAREKRRRQRDERVRRFAQYLRR